MSDEAIEYMRKLGELWSENKRGLIQFDRGKEEDVHSELQALGLIRRLGTRGAPWALTAAGQHWLMDNRKR